MRIVVGDAHDLSMADHPRRLFVADSRQLHFHFNFAVRRQRAIDAEQQIAAAHALGHPEAPAAISGTITNPCMQRITFCACVLAASRRLCLHGARWGKRNTRCAMQKRARNRDRAATAALGPCPLLRARAQMCDSAAGNFCVVRRAFHIGRDANVRDTNASSSLEFFGATTHAAP